jgi:hypothetical protein
MCITWQRARAAEITRVHALRALLIIIISPLGWGAQPRLISSVCLPSQQRCGLWKGLRCISENTHSRTRIAPRCRIIGAFTHSEWIRAGLKRAPLATPLSLYGANFKVKKAPCAAVVAPYGNVIIAITLGPTTLSRGVECGQIWIPRARPERYIAERVTTCGKE